MSNLTIDNLEIYKLAKEITKEGWKIYTGLDWRDKKVIGDQFITAIDSIGANIAEGFGRFHYLDKNKFNYNARGSLCESVYWLDILLERGKIKKEIHKLVSDKLNNLHKGLNSYISSTRKQSK